MITNKYNNHFFPYYSGISKYGTLNRKQIPFRKEDLISFEGSVLIEIRNKYGSFLDRWYFKQEKEDNFIVSFDLKMEGAGEIQFYDLNKKIHAGDLLTYSLNGETRWIGRFKKDVSMDDKKGVLVYIADTLKTEPVTATFESSSIKDVIKTVFEQVTAATGINYDENFVDIGKEENITAEYKCVPAWDILEDMKKLCINRYIGVNTDLIFYMKKAEKEKCDFVFYNSNPDYEKISFPDKDYKKAKYTRAEVWQGSEKIGEVGTNNDFPSLSIERHIQPAKGKIKAPVEFDQQTALKWAYGKLKEVTKANQNILIKAVNRKKYTPAKGDFICIQSQRNRMLTDLNICLSSYNWQNAVEIYNLGYFPGDTCLELLHGESISYYDFQDQFSYYKQEIMGMNIKGKKGDVIQVGTGNTIDTVEYESKYLYSDNWAWYSIDVKNKPFRYLCFSTDSVETIQVDSISILSNSFSEVEKTVKSVRDKLSRYGLSIDIETEIKTDSINEDFAELEEKLRTIKD